MRGSEMGKHRVVEHSERAARAVRAGGFTLVELMVTIAVLAILLMIGVPSFSGVIASNRLSTGANELVASLQLARMESMRRNTRVIVCRSADQATCSTGTTWTGWITFVDVDRNGVPAAAEVLRVSAVPSPVEAYVSADIASGRIFFRPDGRAYKAASDTTMTDELQKAAVGMCIATKATRENQRVVSMMGGSRISTKREGTGTGACPTPASPT